jgi:hypothetical protein
VFAFFAVRREGGEVGLAHIGERQDGREAARVAARTAGAGGKSGVRAGKGMPENPVEQNL